MAVIIILHDVNTKSIQDMPVTDYIYNIEKIDHRYSYTDLISDDTIIRIFRYDKSDTKNENYKVGDIIKVSGKLTDNYNTYDRSYGFYLKGNGYNYTLIPNKIKIISFQKDIHYYIEMIRTKINNIINSLYPYNYSIVKALILGDKSGITDLDRDTMSKSGISHIISISGFHILLISGLVDKSVFFLSKWQRYTVSLIVTFLYVILTGMSPSCVRAYVFYLVYIISVFTCKRYDTKSVAYLLASIYISFNPYIIFNISFCLSFIAVVSIATYNRPITNYFVDKPYYLKYKTYIDLAILTVSAQILTIPYMYYQFSTLSLISIASNIVCVPLITASYPFIILSLLLYRIKPLSWIFSFIVSKILDTFMFINAQLIRLPYAYMVFQKSYLTITIILYILIFASNYHRTVKSIKENTFYEIE